jgi:hypothetical protein
VGDDNYGVFVDLHPGGFRASFSIFLSPTKNLAIKDLIANLVTAIGKVKPDSIRGNVTATPIDDNNVKIDR